MIYILNLWILVLFIINTKWDSRNEFIDEIIQFLINSLNNSILYKSCIIFHALKSLIIYIRKILHFLDHFKDCTWIADISIKDHSNFRFIIYSFTIDSSINIIYSDIHSIKWIIHSSLSSLFHYKAWYWN